MPTSMGNHLADRCRCWQIFGSIFGFWFDFWFWFDFEGPLQVLANFWFDPQLSRSRLLSELCPGWAGRPIELGIFIPHPPHQPTSQPTNPLCRVHGGLRRCTALLAARCRAVPRCTTVYHGGTVLCWFRRNITLIRRRS